MTALGWVQLSIGFLFVTVFIVFFIYTFIKKPELSKHQESILHILSSLCSGFCGALFTGTALLSIEIPISAGGHIAIQGTAGITLFLIVYLNFKKIFLRYTLPTSVNGNINVNIPPIPSGNKFSTIADIFTQVDNSLVEFIGFRDEERDAEISSRQLQCKSIEEALLALRLLSKKIKIRKYTVIKAHAIYKLEIIDGGNHAE